MQVTKLIKKKEDGSFEAVLALSEDQTQFLVNFALNLLVQQGIAVIVEQEVDDFASDAQEQQEQKPSETIN